VGALQEDQYIYDNISLTDS